MEYTLDELIKVQKEELDRLLVRAGSVNHLALMLQVHYMTVVGWIDRGRISKGGAELVEGHVSLGQHFTAKDLRPDL